MGCGASKSQAQIVEVASPVSPATEKAAAAATQNNADKATHEAQIRCVQEPEILPNPAKPRYEHEHATTTAALAYMEARPTSENEGGSEDAPAETPVKKMCILGGGAFGTALSLVMAKKGSEVAVFDKPPAGAEAQAKACNEDSENKAFLPGCRFPEPAPESGATRSPVWWHHDPAAAMEGAEVVLFAIPAPFLRGFCEKNKASIPKGVPLVVCTRGLEAATMKTPSEVMAEVLGAEYMKEVVVMSGPTASRELAEGQGTSVVVAGHDSGLVQRVQGQLSCRAANFRTHASDDPVGCEVAGAVKHVLAVAGGCLAGVGVGQNTRAALSCRARAEVVRLANAMGSNGRAMGGVAGAGDVLASASAELVRSFAAGQRLAQGQRPDLTDHHNQTLDNLKAPHAQSAEGVAAAKTVHALAESKGVSMPLCDMVYNVLYNGTSVPDALAQLYALPLPNDSDVEPAGAVLVDSKRNL